MVVILLVTPYATNGCDGGSNAGSGGSSSNATSVSTASTGDTVILVHNATKSTPAIPPQAQHYPPPAVSSHLRQRIAPPCWACYVGGGDANARSPPPPPLPKSKPPYDAHYGWQGASASSASFLYTPNAVPKPPRRHATSTAAAAHEAYESFYGQPASINHPLWQAPAPAPTPMPPATSSNGNNFTTTTADIVRHVTRVNFYDVDTSQVEYEEPKDNAADYAATNDDVVAVNIKDADCDTEAITKEEEWITKRKTELTTTRQIETRVKRQLLLEDGKVVEDSGPIVSTNTTEDTDKQETETTEKRDLGVPVASVKLDALTGPAKGAPQQQQLAELEQTDGGGGKLVKMVPRPADGLVREINDKRMVSHEEVKDYVETEDVRHLGDFSDETYVQAVSSGTEDLQAVLLQATEQQQQQQQLVPAAPRLVANKTKSFKTIDTEDQEQRCLAQADGRLITESKKTTEHEVILDDELPAQDDRSAGSHEKITTVEATQHYHKQRDEQHVDLIANGKVVGTEMRYSAETMHVEKDSSLEKPGDWDSLSDRMRKLRQRQHGKTLLQQHKEAALLADRKDALTKRPLDFDREEETRKGETMKWLESHFGSESTASNDSREEDVVAGGEIEPTKKTYFNVTIKSNQPQSPNGAGITATPGVASAGVQKPAPPNGTSYDRKPLTNGAAAAAVAAKSKYFQGISNWSERNEAPPTPRNHFASKAFREDLQETVRLRRGVAVGIASAAPSNGGVYAARDKFSDARFLVEPSDTYVSREDILQQKRQSLSSQFLAKTRQSASREQLDQLDTLPRVAASKAENGLQRHVGVGSRPELRYSMSAPPPEELGKGFEAQVAVSRGHSYGGAVIETRAKSYERELNEESRYEMQQGGSATLGRPTVPQRRRAIERKLRQQEPSLPPLKVPSLNHQQQRGGDVLEPPPDYSPPPRSRSSSPRERHDIDYATQPRTGKAMAPSSTLTQAVSTSTLNRRQNQRTRFAPTAGPQTPTSSYRPLMSTQTTQTTHSTISGSTAVTTSQKSSSRGGMGQAIRNSLGKLVNKIRSASAERKMRMRSKSKSREQSPSSSHHPADKQSANGHHANTYQQYNMSGQPVSQESEQESLSEPLNGGNGGVGLYSNSATLERNGKFRHANSADPYVANGRGESPRQRYYLGEDPYSSTLGKENIYDPSYLAQRKRNGIARDEGGDYVSRNVRESSVRRDEGDYYAQRTTSANTLGRYQKSQQRFAGSTPNLNQDYRTTQTLPRKLHEQQQVHKNTPQRYVSHTLGHPERRAPAAYQTQTQISQGPAKPARTYAKALNRSKSFSVHAMNGSQDPSPVYIEKVNSASRANGHNGGLHYSNNYNNYGSNLHASQAYKSNPHLYSGGGKENSLMSSGLGLKSPSIVNLISRSQRDLSKIGEAEDERELSASPGYRQQASLVENRKREFLRGTQQSDAFRSLPHAEDGDDDVDYVPSQRAPRKYQQQQQQVQTREIINKDTASIIRGGGGGNSSSEDYVTSYGGKYVGGRSSELAQHKRIHLYKDETSRRRGSTGPTIIEVRRK